MENWSNHWQLNPRLHVTSLKAFVQTVYIDHSSKMNDFEFKMDTMKKRQKKRKGSKKKNKIHFIYLSTNKYPMKTKTKNKNKNENIPCHVSSN